jgi:hypothetical protein
MSTATAATRQTEPAHLRAPELRPMRFDDYENVRALLLDHSMECPSFEDWGHRWIDNPLWQRFGRASPIGWVLETVAGEIVGSMETIPTLYKFRGSNLIASASGAWCVKASYRGYALQLIDEYFNQPVDLFISTTVGREAITTLSQFYEPIPVGQWDTTSYFITEHILFARRALRKYHMPLAPLLAYPTGWTLRLRDAFYNEVLPEPPPSVLVETTDKFDARFDTFWDELVQENRDKLLAERSSRALSWHFDAAIRRNRLWIFTASKFGRMRGYCILRSESWPGGTKVVLTDYQSLEGERDLLPGFLRAALRRCAAEGFYSLQNAGVGVPKMRAFDEYAPYRRKLANSVFFYGAADKALEAELRQSRFWDPSLFDGDATL